MDFTNMTSVAPMLASFAVLGTVLGVIIRGWASIKTFFFNCSGLFIVRVKLDDETTTKSVLAYLNENYRKFDSAQKTYSGKHENLRDGKYGYIPFELLGDKTVTFFNGIIPFWYCVEENPKADGDKTIYWGSKPKCPKNSSLIYVRYTLNIDKIIKEASRCRNKLYWNSNQESHKRFFIKKIPDPNAAFAEGGSASTNVEWFYEGIYRLIDHNHTEIGKSFGMKPGEQATKRLYFPAHITKLIDEVKTWFNLKDWYVERGIPWKRGWCLYGPPGTGKSALVRAIAEDLDMPLFVFSLGRITDKDLELSWNHMQAHTPCIALFEDFDTVFNGRENIYGKANIADIVHGTSLKQGPDMDASGMDIGKLSFGCLLNCIDGVDKSNGIFTIFTTNHIDKLDSALGQPRTNPDGSVDFISTRPGRIDKAIELGYMTKEDKYQLAKRIFFDDEVGMDNMFDTITMENKQETPAQFQERCAQLALELVWKRKNHV